MVKSAETEFPDFRENGYQRVSGALNMIGEDLFDLEFTDEQRAYWSEVMKIMFYLDDIIDQDQPRDLRFDQFDRALAVMASGQSDEGLSDEKNDLLLKFRETMLDLDPALIENFTRNAHTIALLGERMRRTQSTKILAASVLAEGRVTSRLVAAVPNGTISGDPETFNKYLEIGTAGSNALDTVIDLKRDSNNGLLNLDPTFRNRSELLGRILPSVVESFGPLTPRLVAKMLFTIATWATHKE